MFSDKRIHISWVVFSDVKLKKVADNNMCLRYLREVHFVTIFHSGSGKPTLQVVNNVVSFFYWYF